MPARAAATVLGISANGVAQLALRARAGLRRNYLQAHVRNGIGPGCRTTVDHLGAYVAGALARRDMAKVQRHLDACAECRARLAELEDLGSTLRRGVVALPLGLGAVAAGRTLKASAASSAARIVPSVARRALATAAAGMLAVGVAGVLLVPRTTRPAGPVTRTPAAAPAPAALQLSTAVQADGAPTPPLTESPPPQATQSPAAPGRVVGAGSTQPSPPGPPPSDGAPPAPPRTPDAGQPGLEVTASGVLGLTDVGVAAGACTAVTADAAAGGCITDPRSAPGVTLAVSAPGLSPITLPIP